MKMTKDIEYYILTWGELATRWGLNRTEAQIHALLFVTEAPLTMENIAQTLGVARSNVSNSLKELLGWKIIRTVNVRGNRSKHYVAIQDVWEMLRSVVFEQKRRNIDPFIGLARDTKAALDRTKSRDPAEDHALRQVTRMLEFLDAAMSWYAQLQAMPTATIRQYMKLGGKVLNLRKLF
jgi:DNA-binding transcriptional regulator GbsR (MarR family)